MSDNAKSVDVSIIQPLTHAQRGFVLLGRLVGSFEGRFEEREGLLASFEGLLEEREKRLASCEKRFEEREKRLASCEKRFEEREKACTSCDKPLSGPANNSPSLGPPAHTRTDCASRYQYRAIVVILCQTEWSKVLFGL